jgi:hypothetical protein
MDAIKVEPDSDEESHCASSHSGGEQLTDIKHEVETVPEQFYVVKTEACVSYVYRYSFTFILEGQNM